MGSGMGIGMSVAMGLNCSISSRCLVGLPRLLVGPPVTSGGLGAAGAASGLAWLGTPWALACPLWATGTPCTLHNRLRVELP